jgi:hypothetical protein
VEVSVKVSEVMGVPPVVTMGFHTKSWSMTTERFGVGLWLRT